MYLDAAFLQRKFEQGMPYGEFVASGEREGHRPPWDDRYGKLELDDAQRGLVEGFTREMNVLCMTGTWCGDCALQGSAMARVAEANPGRIHLRYLPRHEEHADLITKAPINGGFRVPVTWMLAEDFEPVSVFGDRTLSRYRSIALKQLGPAANVLAPPPADPVREVLKEVLELFERAQLVLLVSPRLRAKHGD
jgi:hypothetical protein